MLSSIIFWYLDTHPYFCTNIAIGISIVNYYGSLKKQFRFPILLENKNALDHLSSKQSNILYPKALFWDEGSWILYDKDWRIVTFFQKSWDQILQDQDEENIQLISL